MPKQSVLIIEDEKDIRSLLQYNLEKEGYRLSAAKTGEQGFEAAKSLLPDLVILDLMLPGMDGLEVCKLLRGNAKTRHIPILMLTAKGTETDQVVGFELGATDYMTKPFSVKVLMARVKNIFKNNALSKSQAKVVRAGDLLLNKDRMTFAVKGKPVALTKLEFQVLAFLMENPGRVYSRQELLTGAWGQEAYVVDRTVDVHVKSIRKKLKTYRDFIQTVRGVGYRFKDTDDS